MTPAVCVPDVIRVQLVTDGRWVDADGSGVQVMTAEIGSGLRVQVATADTVSRVLLRWRRSIPEGVAVLGDAWERSYGDLQWRGMQPERVLPWMALWHHRRSGVTTGIGVQVRGGAFAGWTLDPDGVSLWLDLRCGGVAVRPGDRAIDAAVIREVSGSESPFAVYRDLCATLCSDPLRTGPLVGANNWYYAYGRGFDASAVLRDARAVADLAGDHPVRPFAVIDDGWSPDGMADGRPGSGGPWDSFRAAGFPAGMPGTASAVAELGVRPGIWFRPLLSRVRPDSGGLDRRRTDIFGGHVLDPSSSATLRTVADDIARFVDWGFELIKHDFSTFDVVGQWGVRMGASPGLDGWSLADPTVTTAEALGRLYRTIHDAAGPAVVLGCNVVGHLAAGLMQGQRVGDDTSGRIWSRTRRTGVNALAFRLAQHNTILRRRRRLRTQHPRDALGVQPAVAGSGVPFRHGPVRLGRPEPPAPTRSMPTCPSRFGGPWTEVIPAGWNRWTGWTPPAPSGGERPRVRLTYRWQQDWGADPFEGYELVLDEH